MRYNGRVGLEAGAVQVIVVDGLTGDLCLDFSNRLVQDVRERTFQGDRLLRWLTKASLAADDATYARDPQKTVERAAKLCLAINCVFVAAAVEAPIPEASLKLIEREANAALGALGIAPAGDGFAWVSRYDRLDIEQALGPVALSASMLLTGPMLPRVRLCANETCGWLFLDQSKNHSRKWCDMADCGNKIKARRHYAKVRAAKERGTISASPGT